MPDDTASALTAPVQAPDRPLPGPACRGDEKRNAHH